MTDIDDSEALGAAHAAFSAEGGTVARACRAYASNLRQQLAEAHKCIAIVEEQRDGFRAQLADANAQLGQRSGAEWQQDVASQLRTAKASIEEEWHARRAAESELETARAQLERLASELAVMEAEPEYRKMGPCGPGWRAAVKRVKTALSTQEPAGAAGVVPSEMAHGRLVEQIDAIVFGRSLQRRELVTPLVDLFQSLLSQHRPARVPAWTMETAGRLRDELAGMHSYNAELGDVTVPSLYNAGLAIGLGRPQEPKVAGVVEAALKLAQDATQDYCDRWNAADAALREAEYALAVERDELELSAQAAFERLAKLEAMVADQNNGDDK